MKGTAFRFMHALFAACMLAAGSAWAQAYPTKPIHLIVPFPPGGVTDLVGRIIAQRLSDRLGQQVIVENRGGGASRSAWLHQCPCFLRSTLLSRRRMSSP